MSSVIVIIAALIAYLLGSVASSIIVCKFAGKSDPRTQGSRNPGTTNVLRIAGKKWAVVTLLGDVLKGVIAVLLGRTLGLHGFELSLTALAVFLGHLYPVFFGFKGGKGVATGFGAIVTLSPIVGLMAIVIWLIVALVFRHSSLAALMAVLLVPVYMWFFSNRDYFPIIAIMAIFLVWRHRGNIVRLCNKTEKKIGQ